MAGSLAPSYERAAIALSYERAGIVCHVYAMACPVEYYVGRAIVDPVGLAFLLKAP